MEKELKALFIKQFDKKKISAKDISVKEYPEVFSSMSGIKRYSLLDKNKNAILVSVNSTSGKITKWRNNQALTYIGKRVITQKKALELASKVTSQLPLGARFEGIQLLDRGIGIRTYAITYYHYSSTLRVDKDFFRIKLNAYNGQAISVVERWADAKLLPVFIKGVKEEKLFKIAQTEFNQQNFAEYSRGLIFQEQCYFPIVSETKTTYVQCVMFRFSYEKYNNGWVDIYIDTKGKILHISQTA